MAQACVCRMCPVQLVGGSGGCWVHCHSDAADDAEQLLREGTVVSYEGCDPAEPLIVQLMAAAECLQVLVRVLLRCWHVAQRRRFM